MSLARAAVRSPAPYLVIAGTAWTALALSRPAPLSFALLAAPVVAAALVHDPRVLFGAILVGIPLAGATQSVAAAAVVGYGLPLLALGLWAVRAAWVPEPLPRLPATLAWWFPAWIAWVFLCACASAFPMEGIAESVRFLLLALVVTAAWRVWSTDAVRAMHVALAAALAALAAQGLLQAAGAGMAAQARSMAEPARWSGLFENPNSFGFFMAYGFVLAAAWALAPRGFTLARGTAMAAGAAVALLFLVAVFISFSRAAMLYAGTAGLVLGLALPRLRWWIVGAAGAAAAWLLVTLPPWLFVVGRLNAGLSDRDALWRVALRVVRDHPWTGIGSGNGVFETVRRAYIESVLSRELFYVEAGGAHNVFLSKAAELGVPGLVLTVVVFGLGLRRVPAALRAFRGGDWFAGFLAAAMVAFTVHGFFEIGQTLGHGRITGALPFFLVLLGLEDVRRRGGQASR